MKQIGTGAGSAYVACGIGCEEIDLGFMVGSQESGVGEGCTQNIGFGES